MENERKASLITEMEMPVVLNVGGVTFKTLSSTLAKVPNSRLSRLVEDMNVEAGGEKLCVDAYDKPKEFFFDRNPSVFECVLELYRSGELHFPKTLCGSIVKNELTFWDIPLSRVSECCQGTIDASDKQVEWQRDMVAKLAPKEPHCKRPGNSEPWLRKAQYQLWYAMEYPASSIPAAIYGAVYAVFTFASVLMVILTTSESLRIPKLDQQHIEHVKANISNPKELVYFVSEQHPAVTYIDLVCVIFFTIELPVRFLSYPSKKVFCKSPINILDIVCLMVNWAWWAISVLTVDHNPLTSNIRDLIPLFLFLASMSVMRMFRLLIFAYAIPMMKILILSVIESWKVLVLMVIVMLFGVFVWAPLIYIADFYNEASFPDMGIACWWAIVTMTTVGYGDQYPGTFMGYIIGSMCALTGLVMTALPIAVVGNNFGTLYDFYADNKELCMRQPASKENEIEPEELSTSDK